MIQNIPNKSLVYGLVLSGGYSNRMGHEKATIQYYDKPHSIYTADLICEYCDKTFLSYRKSQKAILSPNYPIIYDTYADIGPMSGLLSAIELHPNVAWLLIACDMPYIDKKVISRLIDQRNGDGEATCYWQQSDDGTFAYPEPLASIYEPKFYKKIKISANSGSYSLSKLLRQSSAQKLNIEDSQKLQSANTTEDMEKAIKYINENLRNH